MQSSDEPIVGPILLASTSPRRREILHSLGIGFVLADPGIDEASRDGSPPPRRVLELAEDKARAAAAGLAGSMPRLVLAADTLVALPRGRGESVLGKPKNRADAGMMIALIAGKSHFVHTGLALLDRGSGCLRLAASVSIVSFAPMTDAEIETYLDSGEWEGAAGAYRIQGLAACHITRIEGSWSGIVGLPIHELYGMLRDAGYRFRSCGY
jgi:septum formation protein